MRRVVVAAPVPADVLERLRERADVTDVSALPREAWGPALAGAWGMLIASGVRVDDALLAEAPQLQLVATVSVGYDNVDTAALARRGVTLTNSRGSLVEAVADLTFALVVLARRNLGTALVHARTGGWSREPAPFGHDVADATLGILGLGDIGLAVVPRARAAGMRVIYHNRTRRRDDDRTGAEYTSFEALLERSDVLVVLVPLNDATRGMIDAAALARMQPGAVVVNVARGPVVDNVALLAALERGALAGAALDVTDPYPLPAGHRLYDLPQVIVTPHMGSATHETRHRMAMLAATNLLAGIAGEPLPTPVTI